MKAPSAEHAAAAPPGKELLWWRMFRPYRGWAALLMLCQAVQAFASLSLPSLSADAIDKGILAGDTGALARIALLMLLAACAQIGFSSGAAWLGARVAIGVGRDLRQAIFSHVQDFSLAEMRQFGAPSLITRTTNDVQQIQTMLVMFLTMVIMAPIMGIGSLVMAARQDAQLSWLLFVTVPLLGAVVGLIIARALPLFGRMQALIDRVNQILREQITGLRVIRAFVRDAHERERFASANDTLTDTALRVGRLMALNMPASLLIMQGASVVLVWLAAGHIQAGTLEVGSLVAFLAYITHIMISVMIASMLFAMAPRALVSARRIEAVLLATPSVADAQQPVDAARLDGSIVFEGVGFAYPGAGQPVLSAVDFRIGPGQTIGMIGATGSGKSTIVHLIARLFDATQGTVRVGGHDVRELALDALWRHIGLVPQQSYLFSGTLADNLRYGKAEATDEELWTALEIAQASEFVAALPLGLATPVAQGGGNFSGGQRQRLAIARALVRRPAIYLFDDSFSALDLATEARLRAALREATAGATMLIVGQRISSLRQADAIVVLEHGRLAGFGTHEKLLQECLTYREIVQSQQAAEALP